MSCLKNGVLAFSTLGKNGRFANNVFQYAFLRMYAQKHGMSIETSEWIGQKIFGLNDPPVSRRLPTVYDWSNDINKALMPNASRVFKNTNIWGWFQYQTSYYKAFQKMFRSIFTPVESIKNKLDRAVSKLRCKGETVIGFHLRRGDYGKGDFYISPDKWYLQWLEKNWHTINNPVLFIASDDIQNAVHTFSRYSPITSESLGVSLPEAPFYSDYYILSQSDIMVVSNSSFSISACMLNTKAIEFFRPSLNEQKLIVFDPWNCEVVWKENKESPSCFNKLSQMEELKYAEFTQTIYSLCKENKIEEVIQYYDYNRGKLNLGSFDTAIDLVISKLKLKVLGS